MLDHCIKIIIAPITIFCIMIGLIDKNIQIVLFGIALLLIAFLSDYFIYGRDLK
ncbi:hypothetical protein [Gottfriedia luciferensis]|uniref:hypothetical protein n=1 Tax=Gottfriedia luciferensis TaxID=178774 RepID=UPI0013023921|nr:hypothetical protein [Gottfriedia luciferensis]